MSRLDRLRAAVSSDLLLQASAVVVLLAPVVWALLERVPADVDNPALVEDTLGWRPLAVDPAALHAESDGWQVARFPLWSPNPSGLLKSPEVWVLMATRQTHPVLHRTRLAVRGAACVYESRPGARLLDNQPLQLVRDRACQLTDDLPAGRLDLEVTFYGGQVVVWSYVAPAPVQGVLLYVSDGPPPAGTSVPVLRGRYVAAGLAASALRRIDLLGYVWQVSTSPALIWIAVAAAAALLVAGLAVFPKRPAPAPPPNAVAAAAAGSAAIALALGVLYAVLVPPFHAPDEPDHLLAYARAVGRPELEPQAADLARIGHFERIKFRSEEQFRPVHIGRPYPVAWGSHVHAEDLEGRSPATQELWLLSDKLLALGSAARVLLATRILNALLFSLAVAVGCWLMASMASPSMCYPQFLGFPFLLVPTLPFFAMHFSEFAVLTIGYVLFASCVVAVALDGSRSHLLGVPLGLAAAAVVAGGRSGLPMAPLCGALGLGRIMLGTHGTTAAPQRRAAAFWTGVTAGGLLVHSVLAGRYHTYVQQDGGGGGIPAAMTVSSFLARHGVWVVLVLGVFGALAETAFAVLRRRIPSSIDLPKRIAMLAALVLLAAMSYGALIGTTALEPFPEYGPFWNAPISPPRPAPYVRDVLRGMVGSFRLGASDHLLVESFWGGFGWLDTKPGWLVPTGLHWLSGLALLVLVLRLGRGGEARRLAWLACLAVGLVGSLCLYAAASAALGRNLHGRYLVGWYLSTLGLAWTSAAGGHQRPTRSSLGVGRGLLILVALVAHSWSLSAILRRYF